MGKFTRWYDQQNETTRAWLDKQAIWHDKDMAFSFVTGIMFGIIIGVIIW
jgi:F0F1-type ATP synthase assembly protein I